MSQNGVPSFHLNLSEISKSVAPIMDDLPPIPTKDDVDNNKTIQPTRKRPEPVRGSIARKNFVADNSDSSDTDIEDIVALPVGKAEEKKEKVDDDIQDAVQQMTVLPDLEDRNDDDISAEKSNINMLLDLMLTPEQFNEPNVEWTFSKFVKNFAKNEANCGDNMNGDEEEDLMYEEEEEYEDDDDYDDESI